MADMAVYVVAHWLAKAGADARVAELLPEIAAASRAEPGCLEYRAVRARENPREFVLFEGYADEAALAAHRESAHFKALVTGTVVPLLEERRVTLYGAV
ncbi:putative quinol monooxygenase [Streptomyces sp. NPDC094032]|uniref:putative quinol monooxygenase n=1 Tax=Streptomyces sp. NPDC094032 TaxID=3155308 RepID=UPI003323E4E9